ncbi:hypothetical protein [Citrobacter sp. R-1.5.2]|uniref:hypothetical protein n=1 Tax=Citrobacter sp. R-1.5.2 TaxID=3046183 RepID=UPI002B255E0B|nr:hypothetical protein [Citrobacter sp. R-1.5.2]MEB2418558.1 hypothetical protein [Citrobacter sp. R-1.5.2]
MIIIKNVQLRESFSGVVGQSRNARMSVAAASATATFLADELIVEESGGRQYRLTSFSKTINLATTGAGGMDTGSVPTTGFVALYAIYNPTTATSALLAVNATNANVREVYGGTNMPAGFTASALVAVWGVESGQFIIGDLVGRILSIQQVTVLSTSSPVSTATPISLVNTVPLNAKAVSGLMSASAGGSSNIYNIAIDVAPRKNMVGRTRVANSGTNITGIFKIQLTEPSTIYYAGSAVGTTNSSSVYVTSYEI